MFGLHRSACVIDPALQSTYTYTYSTDHDEVTIAN